MGAGEIEDARCWEKIYDFFFSWGKKPFNSPLGRISVREVARQMGYILERLTKYVMKMVIYEENYCLILCD